MAIGTIRFTLLQGVVVSQSFPDRPLEARSTDEGGELASPESTRGKGRTSGRPDLGIHGGTQRSSTMSTELSRLSELAKAGKTTRFLSIAHPPRPVHVRGVCALR